MPLSAPELRRILTPLEQSVIVAWRIHRGELKAVQEELRGGRMSDSRQGPSVSGRARVVPFWEIIETYESAERKLRLAVVQAERREEEEQEQLARRAAEQLSRRARRNGRPEALPVEPESVEVEDEDGPVTVRQRAKLIKLCRETGTDMDGEDRSELTKGEAAELIRFLRTLPRVR